MKAFIASRPLNCQADKSGGSDCRSAGHGAEGADSG